MHMHRRDFALASALALASGGAALAQATFPNKPVKLIVPFPPGSSDAIARKIAEHVERSLGQPLVVETRPGAQGIIGSRLAAKSKGDGYTLLQGSNSTHSASAYMFKDLGFDPEKDFTPIAHWTINPLMLVVRADLPIQNVADFIRYAKANSGKISYGVGNAAGIVTGHMLQKQIGFEGTLINYPGTGQAVVDLAGGRLDFMVTDPMIAYPHVQSGKLRILGISTRKRLPLMPEVVPLVEQGLPQFEYASWIGVFAPAGLPAEVSRTLHEAYAKALADPAIAKFLADQGAIPMQSSREEFGVFLREQRKFWEQLIREAGIPMQ